MRRDALKLALAAGAAAVLSAAIDRQDSSKRERLHIAKLEVELAPGVVVRTFAFNGSAPGPQLAVGPAARPLEVCNDTDSDKAVQFSAIATPVTIPARDSRRLAVRLPEAVGVKHYQAFCAASGEIAMGTMTPQPPAQQHDGGEPYDRAHALTIQHWQPTSLNQRYSTFDDKLYAASDPIRVREGQRVRFHIANASAVRAVSLALSQHRFRVLALDGHAVPSPREVERLFLGPGESIDASVNMDRPGRWVFGSSNRDDRNAGLGRLIEYAGARGSPVEAEFGVAPWDYGWFGETPVACRPPIESPGVRLRVARAQASAAQLVDPAPLQTDVIRSVAPGARYRMALINATREPQALRLLDHELEIVGVAGRRTGGVLKDVVTVPSFTRIDCEFSARTARIAVLHDRYVTLESLTA